MKKVILTCDATCDLTEELYSKYKVAEHFPLHICYGDVSLDDGVNIVPAQVFEKYAQEKQLPTTAAISIGEYLDYFKNYTDKGCEVVHISIGSKLSCSNANALAAAEQLGGVYIVDSQNLSSASGLLVIEASERIAKGMEAKQIAAELTALVPKCHASFVLDTLKFLAAGGRCSAVVALGANLLQIKPSIEVDNQGGGSMAVGKKYRGKLGDCVEEYVKDQLAKYGDGIRTERVFITHSGIDAAVVENVKRLLKGRFDEIFVTTASCTISSHCGPNCIGVLFETK